MTLLADQSKTLSHLGRALLMHRPKRNSVRRHCVSGSFHVLYPAVVAPVCEVHHQTDDQPDNESRPVYPAQLVHHVAIEDYAHDGHEGHPRRAERTRLPWI